MPELPEVQTTVNFLKSKVLSRTIVDVWTDSPKLIKTPSGFAEFKKEICQLKIKNIKRVGKNIIFDLSKDYSLLIHQKLTGHLLYGKWEKRGENWESVIAGPLEDDPMNRFLRILFFLDNGWQIALSDLRKFAKVELLKTKNLQHRLKKEIGPDVFEISVEEFERILRKKKGLIKKVLMDQKTISGIGNIYSDEILFDAKIHPLKRVEDLTPNQLRKIYFSARKILTKAIVLKGTSISDYRTPAGQKGEFEKFLKVYRKEGEKCPRCGRVIERIKIGTRSAHFCPWCQRL